jgi:hypothetical protein
MEMATQNTAKKVSFEELFEEDAPQVELKPDVVEGDVPLTAEERGTIAARDRLAAKMGADAADIGIVREDIALRLMEGGMVVDLDIHTWTGVKRLLPRDLGISDKRARSKAIKLGEKLLMPPTIKRQINSLVAQLRQNLDRHSIRTFWGRWVPASAYQEWKERHDQLTKEYLEVGEALAANLDQIMTSSSGMWGELRRIYAEHARAAWCREHRLPVDEANLDMCPGRYVEEYIQKIFVHMPTADEIRDKFQVVANISFIPLPSILQEDRLRSDRLWEKAAEERDADRRKREAQEAMEADVRAHYEGQRKQLVDGFLADLAGQVYGRLYDVTTRAIATMSKNQGNLLEPTLRQLRGLVEWAQMMDVCDDTQVQKAVTDLNALISRAAENRSGEDVQAQLKAMGTVARSVLVDLNIQPTVTDTKLSIAERDAVLGIGSRLSRAEVAQAREKLGTADVEELPIVRARRGRSPGAFQEIPQL